MKKFLQNIVKLKKISTIKDFRFGLHILPTLKSENCTFQLFEYISTFYYNLCVSSISKYTINEKVFVKHRKIKKDINNKRFPVRDISVNFRFGFGLHFLPTTMYIIDAIKRLFHRDFKLDLAQTVHELPDDSVASVYEKHTFISCT